MYKNPARIATIMTLVFLLTLAIALVVFLEPKPSQAEENPSTIDKGTIVLVQDTTPDNRRACFDFDVYYEDGLIEDLLLCDDDNTGDRFELVEPGTYTIRQHALAGYDAPDVDCTGVRETILPNGARFELKAGAVVECTFTNERLPDATATPTKTATPSPTSTAVPAPTQSPPTILVACPGTTTLVNLTNGQTCPTNTPAAPTPTAAPVVQQSSTIKPPATGSAGLR